LAPALAIAAAVLLLLGLLYGLRGGEVHTTPGAVAGTSPWVLGGGLVLLSVLLVTVLIVWRRRK
jgi:hypothetical protein